MIRDMEVSMVHVSVGKGAVGWFLKVANEPRPRAFLSLDEAVLILRVLRRDGFDVDDAAEDLLELIAEDLKRPLVGQEVA